jgi:hypothetical protein
LTIFLKVRNLTKVKKALLNDHLNIQIDQIKEKVQEKVKKFQKDKGEVHLKVLEKPNLR